MGCKGPFSVLIEPASAHHGEEDGEVLEVGEDLPDHRLELNIGQKQTRVAEKEPAERVGSLCL